MPDVVANLPKAIAVRIVEQLREKLDMDDSNCYVAAFTTWVEGSQHDKIVQVVPSESSPWPGGDGAQEGGELIRLQTYTIGIWFVSQMDPHQMTEHALVELSDGVLDFCERVRTMLTGADLGFSQQCEQMRFRSESAVQVIEDDFVKLFRTLMFAVPYAVPLVVDGETIDVSTTDE